VSIVNAKTASDVRVTIATPAPAVHGASRLMQLISWSNMKDLRGRVL